MKRTAVIAVAVLLVTWMSSIPTATAKAALVHGYVQQPQQIHLSWDIGHEDCMVVTWNTLQDTKTSMVVFREVVVSSAAAAAPQSTSGESWLFTDQGKTKRTQYVHRSIMCGLKSDTEYEYRVGDDEAGWSSTYRFREKVHSSEWGRPMKIGIYGDMGDDISQALAGIQKHHDEWDAIIHVGDFGYDLHDQEGKVGDRFMNDIEGIAATKAYMTCPGNHEIAQKFNHYINRFARSFDDDPKTSRMWFSFTAGKVRFVSMSSEVYFAAYDQIPEQYAWLEAELAQANKNREQQPWLIVYAHRPLYCSNANSDDCQKYPSVIRDGIKQKDGSFKWGFDELLFKYGVDLAFFGHEHDYERTYPVYKNKMVVGAKDTDPYFNPKATIQIISGSAGCHERHNPFKAKKPKWSAKRFQDYGYGVLTVFNGTDLMWEQHSSDRDGIVADRFYVHQEHHGVFPDIAEHEDEDDDIIEEGGWMPDDAIDILSNGTVKIWEPKIEGYGEDEEALKDVLMEQDDEDEEDEPLFVIGAW